MQRVKERHTLIQILTFPLGILLRCEPLRAKVGVEVRDQVLHRGQPLINNTDARCTPPYRRKERAARAFFRPGRRRGDTIVWVKVIW